MADPERTPLSLQFPSVHLRTNLAGTLTSENRNPFENYIDAIVVNFKLSAILVERYCLNVFDVEAVNLPQT